MVFKCDWFNWPKDQKSRTINSNRSKQFQPNDKPKFEDFESTIFHLKFKFFISLFLVFDCFCNWTLNFKPKIIFSSSLIFPSQCISMSMPLTWIIIFVSSSSLNFKNPLKMFLFFCCPPWKTIKTTLKEKLCGKLVLYKISFVFDKIPLSPSYWCMMMCVALYRAKSAFELVFLYFILFIFL